jgi:hypothetical protein
MTERSFPGCLVCLCRCRISHEDALVDDWSHCDLTAPAIQLGCHFLGGGLVIHHDKDLPLAWTARPDVDNGVFPKISHIPPCLIDITKNLA